MANFLALGRRFCFAVMSWVKIFGRPIAFHRIFVEWTGSVPAALMLSQLIYWSDRTTNKGRWVFKTIADWETETGLKRYDQKTARRVLVSRGLIEEKRLGIPAKLFFRVLESGITKWVKASRLSDHQLVGCLTTNRMDVEQPTNTETTTKTTTGPRASATDRLPTNGLIPEHTEDTSTPEAKLASRYNKFSHKNGLQTVEVRRGVLKRVKPNLKNWRLYFQALLQRHSYKKIKKVMLWYFDHFKDRGIGTYGGAKEFCNNFEKVEKAMRRDRFGWNGKEKENPNLSKPIMSIGANGHPDWNVDLIEENMRRNGIEE